MASKIWGSQLWWRQHHTATCQRLEQLVGTLEQEFEPAVKKLNLNEMIVDPDNFQSIILIIKSKIKNNLNVCNENVHISVPWNLYAEIDEDLKLDPHITKRS